ncbi:hypothetical protein RJ639_020072 [Escallonia herrerae]|uniref:Uncharacterized protein n=1 Tax=Escallonia herrerae TaxID=1293975 RepID=A0AA89AI69_9ASTE|nr:hypothetical protein RJ639_020072 [Escallonia herrerae]
MGTSVDYGVCKGKRKDGMAWLAHYSLMSMLQNHLPPYYLLRRGIYCKYHKLVRAQSHVSHSSLRKIYWIEQLMVSTVVYRHRKHPIDIPVQEMNSREAYFDSFNNNRLNLFYLRNLRTAFQDPLKSRGIYVVDPLVDRTNLTKPMQPKKVLSVEGLRRALRFV